MAAQPTLKQAIKSGEPFALSGRPLFYQGLSFGVRKGQPDLRACSTTPSARCDRTARSHGFRKSGSAAWTSDDEAVEPLQVRGIAAARRRALRRRLRRSRFASGAAQRAIGLITLVVFTLDQPVEMAG